MPLKQLVTRLETPAGAAESAAHFWRVNGCNALADAGDTTALRRMVDLERTLSDTASAVGGKLLESLLPDGAENVGEMVKATLAGLSGVKGPFGPALSSAARAVSRALASPVERLSRSGRVNLRDGNIVCVGESAHSTRLSCYSK